MAPLAAVRLTAALITCATAGCGAAHTHGASSAPATRLPPLDVRASTVIVPRLGPPRLLHRDADGTVYLALGGVRVKVHGHEADVADQGFAADVLGAMPDPGHGWIFVAASGTVARGDDFLGTVHFETSLGQAATDAVEWNGGIGVRLMDGHFAAAGVRGAPDETAFRRAVAARPTVSAEVSAAAVEEAQGRWGVARLVDGALVPLASGQVAAWSGTQLQFAEITLAGRFQPTTTVDVPGIATLGCVPSAWGARVVLACNARGANDAPTENALITPYVVAVQGSTRIAAPSRPPLLVGREGHTLTFRGPCADAAEGASAPPHSASNTYACTLDRDRDWREWEYPSPGLLVDVYDDFALFAERHDTGVALFLYEIDVARRSALPLADPSVEITRAGFAPDGRIVILANAGSESTRRSLVAIGNAGEPISLHAVGFLVHDVAMADEAHGLAVGANAHDIAETSDGGLSWVRVPDLALDGDAAHLILTPPPDDPHERVRRVAEWVECSPLLCRAAGHIVHRWDESMRIVPAIE